MKMNLLIVVCTTVLLADQNPLFPMLVESGSIMHAAFNGGGAAIPDKVNGASLNPATLYGYHKLYGKRFGVSGAYQNKFDGKILSSGGVSFAIDQQNVLGITYDHRNSRTGEAPKIHRGTLTYTSLVHEEPKDGFLSWGANINYLNNSGSYPAQTQLPIKKGDSTTYYQTGLSELSGNSQSVTLDIGLYQVDKKTGLSYGIAFENVSGYTWTKRDNTMITTHSEIKKDSTKISIDTTKYTGNELNSGEWINGSPKSLLVGLCLNRQVFGDRVILMIPFDVRFWGFMDKHLRKNSEWKNRCMLYTGSEINFGGALSLRGGYSWAPYEYITDENGHPLFQNHHQASGGFRLSIKTADIEMAFKKGELGGGLSFYF